MKTYNMWSFGGKREERRTQDHNERDRLLGVDGALL